MWLLPSYKRPKNLLRFMAVAPEVPICLKVDPHDRETLRAIQGHVPDAWTVYPAINMGASEAWQWAFERWPNEAFYGFVADDVVPITPNWHKTLEMAAGDHYIAYPDDCNQSDRLCTHPCIGGDLVRAVGWWGPPGLFHNCCDWVWHQLGDATGLLRFRGDVILDHRHPIFGKAPVDLVYTIATEHKDIDHAVAKHFIATPVFGNILYRVQELFRERDPAT